MSENEIQNENEQLTEKKPSSWIIEKLHKLDEWKDDQIKKGKKFIGNIKEKNAEEKTIEEAFKKTAKKFYVIFKDKTKKEILCIIDESNKILKTDFEIFPNEVQCIQDVRNQDYYIKIVKIQKDYFNYNYNGKELTKELFQIEYSNEKPKQEIHNTTYNIDNSVDNSINAGKNAMLGENIRKETNLNVGLNMPKKEL